MNEHEIFVEAIKLKGDERAAFVKEVCQGDPELLGRVKSLLHAHGDSGGLLSREHDGDLAPTIDNSYQPRVGTLIADRYKLRERIGEGGMASVWLAEQKEPVKRKVAVKLIKPGMDTRAVLARFDAERQALAMMDHPHIAKVHDGGMTGHGRPFFVMELVKGIPLTEYCDQAQLTVRERLELFNQICGAVQHAHQKGIIHRDLKPSNILVTEHDGRPVTKIIDFGLAKALHGAHALTEQSLHTSFGSVLGTPLYMAPEQLGTSVLDVDTRADLYSLGVILYELLTGVTPIERQRLKKAAWEEMRRLVQEEEPPIPSQRLSSSDTLPGVAARRHVEPARLTRLVRGDLDWIVMKALEKDRNRRYETASGLVMDIQRHLVGEPVLAAPPSRLYRMQKFLRRHRGPVLAVSALLLVLIGGIIGTSYGLYQAKQSAKRESLAREDAQKRQAEAERQRIRAENREQEALVEKKRADEQAAIAKAVNQFTLHDVFEFADVSKQIQGGIEPDPNIRLTTLLDRALTKVDQRFSDHPRIRAEVQDTLGSAFQAIGRYEDALALHEKALSYFREHLGDENRQTLYSMNRLGISHLRHGRRDTAIDILRETLGLRKRLLGTDDPETHTSIVNLGSALCEAGRYAEAVNILEPLLEIEVTGPHQRNLMLAIGGLGWTYTRLARHADGISKLQQALGLLKEHLGSRHPDTLVSMNNLALAYSSQSGFEEAIELQAQVVKMSEELRGVDHPNTLAFRINLADIYVTSGRYDEAIQILEQIPNSARQIVGPRHPEWLRGMNTLAASYHVAHRYDAAVELMEQVVALAKLTMGPKNRYTLVSMSNLGTAYGSAGRDGEGVKLLDETLQLQTEVLGAEDADTLTTMTNLSNAYVDVGRYHEAVQLQEKSLELKKHVLPPKHLEILNSMNNLADAYKRVGRFDEAIGLVEETLGLTKEVLGPRSRPTILVMANRAGIYEAAGRYQQAVRLWNEAFENQLSHYGPDDPATPTLKYRLIIARECGSGRWREAAEALSQLDANKPSWFYAQALAWLGANDLDGFHKVVEEMHSRFLQDEEPESLYWVVFTSILRPIGSEHQKSALETAQSLIERDDPTGSYPLAVGAAKFRIGSVDEAILDLEQINTNWESAETEPISYPPAYVWYFLSMANAERGEMELARGWLEQANQWVDREITENNSPIRWNRKLTLKLLRSEAEQLLAE